MKKRIICMLLMSVLLLSAVGCSRRPLGVFTGDETGTNPPTYIPPVDDNGGEEGGENGDKKGNESDSDRFENPFISAEKFPESLVSLNSSYATYYYFRNIVNKNYTLSQLQKCSYDFKTEEFLNYFGFDATDAVNGAVFGMGSDMFASPWNEKTALIRLTFKAIELESTKPHNFVFHIDVTESMAREDVLPLFKQIFVYFAAALSPEDKVSVIVCSANDEIIIDGYTAEDVGELALEINDIEISQGTSCSTDLSAAYELAAKHYIEGGDNRVILISDGDISEKVCSTVENGVESGIFTSVLGFGDGNHRNEKLEKISTVGKGRYFYVDSASRGEAVMGREIFAPLDILAENVQIKVNFDSKYISEYRLIGYVYQGNIDGEEPDVAPTINVYSGDSITVCYEVKLVESVGLGNPELLSAELRYNNSLGGEEFVQGMSIRLGLFTDFPDEDMQFMASVIETVMILQKSEYIGKMTLTDVLGVLDELELDDHPERAEFRELIRKIIQAK